MKADGKICDIYETTTGLRTVDFDADRGFVWNGRLNAHAGRGEVQPAAEESVVIGLPRAVNAVVEVVGGAVLLVEFPVGGEEQAEKEAEERAAQEEAERAAQEQAEQEAAERAAQEEAELVKKMEEEKK